jgi:hypothetical protein
MVTIMDDSKKVITPIYIKGMRGGYIYLNLLDFSLLQEDRQKDNY